MTKTLSTGGITAMALRASDGIKALRGQGALLGHRFRSLMLRSWFSMSSPVENEEIDQRLKRLDLVVELMFRMTIKDLAPLISRICSNAGLMPDSSKAKCPMKLPTRAKARMFGSSDKKAELSS